MNDLQKETEATKAFIEFFDIYNIEHLTAFSVMKKLGHYNKNFIPKNIDAKFINFEIVNKNIQDTIVYQWIETQLRENNNDDWSIGNNEGNIYT